MTSFVSKYKPKIHFFLRIISLLFPAHVWIKNTGVKMPFRRRSAGRAYFTVSKKRRKAALPSGVRLYTPA